MTEDIKLFLTELENLFEHYKIEKKKYHSIFMIMPLKCADMDVVKYIIFPH